MTRRVTYVAISPAPSRRELRRRFRASHGPLWIIRTEITGGGVRVGIARGVIGIRRRYS